MALVDPLLVDSKAKEFIEQRLGSHEPNPIRDFLDHACADKLREEFRRMEKMRVTKVVIPEDLTSDQENKLMRLYPSLNLIFTKKACNAHSFAAASRRCEGAILLQMIGYDHDVVDETDGRDDYATDVGGNFYRHLADLNRGIHSCCPMLDDRDVQRYVQRREALKKLYYSDIKKIKLRMCGDRCGDARDEEIRIFLNDTRAREFRNKWVCLQKAQFCDRTARYGIMLHSNYDVTLRELGDIMTKKKMTELCGCFIYDDRIMYMTEGYIDDLECYFSYSKNRKYIEFTFKNDSAITYRHKVRVYMSYLMVNTFIDSTGLNRFVMELLENRSGIQYFKVTSLPYSVSVVFSPLVHKVWFRSLEGKMKVTFPLTDRDALRSGKTADIVREKVMYLDKDLIDKVMGHAMTATESKFKPVEILSFIQAYTHRIFFGEDVTSRMPSMTFNEKYHLSLAIYVEVYKRKYDVGKMVQFVLECIQYDRDLLSKGIIKRFFSSSRGLYSVFKAALPASCFQSLLGPLYLMVFNMAKSPIDGYTFIEEVPRYISNESIGFSTYIVTAIKNKIEGLFDQAFDRMSCIPRFSTLQIVPLVYPKVLVPELIWAPERVVKAVMADNFNVDVEIQTAVDGEKDILSDGALTERVADDTNWFSRMKNKIGKIFGSKTSADRDEVKEGMDFDLDGMSDITDVDAIACDFADLNMSAKVKKDIIMFANYISDNVPDKTYREYVERYTKMDYNKNDPMFISRAEYKLTEILNQYCLRDIKNALDLCAGPGGFSKALLGKVSDTLVVHYYKEADAGCYMSIDKLRRLDLFGKLKFLDLLDTDLTSDSVVDSVIKDAQKRCFPYELITADGAKHNDVIDKENENYSLIAGEVRIAQSLLADGGVFVLKTFGFSSHRTLQLLSEMLMVFEKYYIHRSSYATPFSTEHYIVAVGYKRNFSCARKTSADKFRRVMIYRDLRNFMMGFENALRNRYFKFVDETIGPDVVQSLLEGDLTILSNDSNSAVGDACVGEQVKRVDDRVDEIYTLCYDKGMDVDSRSEYVTGSENVGSNNSDCEVVEPLVESYVSDGIKMDFDKGYCVFAGSDCCLSNIHVEDFEFVYKDRICRVNTIEQAVAFACFCVFEVQHFCGADMRTIASALLRKRMKKLLSTEKNKVVWDRIKDECMEHAVRTKILASTIMKEALRSTKDCKLFNAVSDDYWGVGVTFKNFSYERSSEYVGLNVYARILEKVRSDMLDEEISMNDVDIDEDTKIGENFVESYSVKADGNCLYYALMSGDDNDAAKLRLVLKEAYRQGCGRDNDDIIEKELCEELTGWGGRSVLSLFSQYYHAFIVVRDVKNAVEYKFGEDIVKPTLILRLAYDGSHYSILPSCSDRVCTRSREHTVYVSRTFNYSPVSIPSLMKTLDCLLNKNFTIFQSFVAFITGSQTFAYVSSLSSMDYSRHMFFNSVAYFCGFHSSCNSASIPALLDQLRTNNYSKTLYIFASISDMDFDAIQRVLERTTCRYFLIAIPWLLKNGYILFAITFVLDKENEVPLVEACNLAKMHVDQCATCLGINDDTSITGVWLNRASNTYFVCESREFTRRVFKTETLPTVDRIYKIFQHDLAVQYDTIDVVARADNEFSIVVPVDAGRLSDSFDREAYASYIVRHFCKFGGVSTIGISRSALNNVRELLDPFLTYVDIVYVEVVDDVTEKAEDHVEFCPEFKQTVISDDVLINAMIEARDIWKVSNQMIVDNVKRLHDRTLSLMTGMAGRIEFTNNKPDYGLIDLSTGKYLVRPRDGCGKYSRGFDGTKLIDIERCFEGDRLLAGVMCGRVSVTKDMRIVNADVIYSNVKNIELKDISFDDVCITLVEGVPGCGKSTYILRNHKFSVDDVKHVVLTATKETAEDMRRRAAEMYGVSSELSILRKRYRTVDSFLVHCGGMLEEDCVVETLWIDEGLMKHFGEIMWCVYLSKARQVFICGDRAQIPFINRNGSVKLYYSKIDLVLDSIKVKFLDKSYRCPADVVAHLNALNVYPGKVTTENTVVYSIKVRNITGLVDVPFTDWKDATVLTFTQQEKTDVILHVGKFFSKGLFDGKVFTVHEYQGKQTKRILLIRLQVKPISIYDSVSHQLVAITRHTREFMYCTVKNDSLATMCRRTFSVAQLKKLIVPTLKGGGVSSDDDKVQFPLMKTLAVESLAFDAFRKNKYLSDFVINHDGVNVVPYHVETSAVDTYEFSVPYIAPVSISNPISALQEFVDVVFPGASTAQKFYDNEIFEGDNMVVPRDRVIITAPYVPRLPRYQCLTSRLRTNCPDNVVTTQKQVVKAYFQRNGNVPDLYGDNNEDLLVSQMVDRFVRTYIADKQLFNRFCVEPVGVNVVSIQDWLATQPVKVMDMLFKDQDVNIFVKELRLYNFALKRLPKPKLELGNESKYVSPQTIAHHCKKVNAIFCPVVRELKRRLLSVLRADKIVYTDMAVEDFEKILSYRLSYEKYKQYRYMMEVDFSKYDKSQGRVALKFELAILKMLGFPEELLATWSVMHVYTRLWSPAVKFKAEIFFQRKSGDAMTFFGNTLFLMATLAHTFPLEREFCMFSGDDSLIFSRRKIESVDSILNLAFKFNLESKLLHYKVPYFCSKFLLRMPVGNWKIIPDPVKVLVKLGRNDLVSWAHRDEYLISLRDNLKDYKNAYFYPFLSAAVSDRYSLCPADFTYYFSAFVSLVYDDKNFSNLYFLEEGHYLNPYRVVLPSLEF
ncbi:RdRp [Xingshan nematode virus 2]|uniref:RdRp n=1 Tax=Xingshan nematode virus 2 TaxID=1923761 RepID=UPI00090BABF2|nr:RdRp [Xingshan nematode virus 2]APG77848.1 RdRp [Xingshan nematode virus 2]